MTVPKLPVDGFERGEELVWATHVCTPGGDQRGDRAFPAVSCWDAPRYCVPRRFTGPRGRENVRCGAHDGLGVTFIRHAGRHGADVTRKWHRALCVTPFKNLFGRLEWQSKEFWVLWFFFFIGLWNTPERNVTLIGKTNTSPQKFFQASGTVLLCLTRHPSCNLCLK